MPVILPIAVFVLAVLITPFTSSNTNDNQTEQTVANEEQKIGLESLGFEESELQIDVKETKSILLNVNPTGATLENIEYKSTDEAIVKVEKDEQLDNTESIYVKITPVSEGTCEVYVKSNDIESNKIKVTIVDNERIEREKQQAEEQAKKEAEAAAAAAAAQQKQAEEQAKAKSSSQTKQATSSSSTSQSTTTKKSTSTQSSSGQTKSQTVYVTPTGKRYHYSSTCGGKNSTATTLDNAKARGLTPCQKCAK